MNGGLRQATSLTPTNLFLLQTAIFRKTDPLIDGTSVCYKSLPSINLCSRREGTGVSLDDQFPRSLDHPFPILRLFQQQKKDHCCRLLYAIDAHGLQYSSNVSEDVIDDTVIGRDLSSRPYLVGVDTSSTEPLVLSNVYVDKKTRKVVKTIRLTEKKGHAAVHIEFNKDGTEVWTSARFVVDTEGRPTEISVRKSLHPLCDSAAVRALRSTRFVAGSQSGKPVPVRMHLPVRFRLVEAGTLTAARDSITAPAR